MRRLLSAIRRLAINWDVEMRLPSPCPLPQRERGKKARGSGERNEEENKKGRAECRAARRTTLQRRSELHGHAAPVVPAHQIEIGRVGVRVQRVVCVEERRLLVADVV